MHYPHDYFSFLWTHIHENIIWKLVNIYCLHLLTSRSLSWTFVYTSTYGALLDSLMISTTAALMVNLHYSFHSLESQYVTQLITLSSDFFLTQAHIFYILSVSALLTTLSSDVLSICFNFLGDIN